MNRSATAIWKGSAAQGSGTLDMQSGAFRQQPYSFKARFQDDTGKSGTNPEELIAAAHAGCFAMALSHMLSENGTPPEKLDVTAVVTYGPAAGGGFEITESALKLVGTVPGMDAATFTSFAEKAKAGCPVSKALGAIRITLDASLA